MMKGDWRPLTGVCVMVVGVYAYLAQAGMSALLSPNAADTHYNLLVQGFRAGQLSLKKDLPPKFAQLADPYDPASHRLYQGPPYRMIDLSYYKGKLYLYFGITPALILFWPVAALTGQYLVDRQAVVVFCATGFLVSVGLLFTLWRRYFPQVSVAVTVACALALGLASGVPVMLLWSDVYEVAISCGYMLTMLALAAIWCALHEPERRCRWLAAASATYGLAVGARPSLLVGAVILMVPVLQAWRERRRIGVLLMAATGPIVLIGLGLMLYNFLRFDSPFEFGTYYMLNWQRQAAQQHFGLNYLWFNFRAYFLEPARWSSRFPFVHDIAVPPLPAGFAMVDKPIGILTNIPLVWLALAVPVAWRSQSGQAASILRWFVMVVVLLFGICALTLGLFCAANFRYEVEFLPALLLLAVVGIFGLERALAGSPVLRRGARCGWGLLLGFSMAFNFLIYVEQSAEARYDLGMAFGRLGKMSEARALFEQALRLVPDYAEAHCSLGVTLARMGDVPEAMEHWDQALHIRPDYPEAHYNLAAALEQAGRFRDAIGHYRQALRIKPDFTEARDALARLQAATTEN
jgi:tetratricopeptide (TPR) repeat protein